MLFTITLIYDPAFYYTPAEMKEMGKGEINVPAVVEEPQVYILGRSKADEAEQLSYAETRIDDLKALTRKLSLANGVEIEDVMRFFFMAMGQLNNLRQGRKKEEIMGAATVMQPRRDSVI